MHRSFSQSRFTQADDLGEDVNPSAYIVNLADCMLVLACGFMVALITYWNIDVTPATQIEESQLAEVDAQDMPEDVTQGGSYYVEAGTAYRDPNTGALYIVENTDGDSGSGTSTSGGTTSGNTSSGKTSTSGSTGSSSGSTSNDDAARNARAAGAD